MNAPISKKEQKRLLEKEALKQLLLMSDKEFEDAIFDAIESNPKIKKKFEKEYQSFLKKSKQKIKPKNELIGLKFSDSIQIISESKLKKEIPKIKKELQKITDKQSAKSKNYNKPMSI